MTQRPFVNVNDIGLCGISSMSFTLTKGRCVICALLPNKQAPEFTGPALFDHLIGAGEDRRRHGKAKRLGGLEIHNQLEFRRLLHRQISRLGALEEPPGVNAGLAPDIDVVNSITDQAAGRRKIFQPIARCNSMA